jgi:hypothetical protein
MEISTETWLFNTLSLMWRQFWFVVFLGRGRVGCQWVDNIYSCLIRASWNGGGGVRLKFKRFQVPKTVNHLAASWWIIDITDMTCPTAVQLKAYNITTTECNQISPWYLITSNGSKHHHEFGLWYWAFAFVKISYA